jgi:hypothetical protein
MFPIHNPANWTYYDWHFGPQQGVNYGCTASEFYNPDAWGGTGGYWACSYDGSYRRQFYDIYGWRYNFEPHKVTSSCLIQWYRSEYIEELVTVMEWVTLYGPTECYDDYSYSCQ